MVVTSEVAPGIHRLGHQKVNWYLLEDSGRFLAIDAGLPGFKDDLNADLAQLGIPVDAIEAVILTHSDADHTGLVTALRDLGARVLIHSADQAKLRKPGPKSGDAAPMHVLPQLWRPNLWGMIALMARNGGSRPPAVTGAVTFGDDDVLDLPGRPRVIPTPGHTPGHCAFLFDAHGALFVGDAMCSWNPITGRRGPQLMPRRSISLISRRCIRSMRSSRSTRRRFSSATATRGQAEFPPRSARLGLRPPEFVTKRAPAPVKGGEGLQAPVVLVPVTGYVAADDHRSDGSGAC